MTDLQLADVQSPTRFEFLNRYFADPRYAEIVPVQRPQEALTPHAVDATLRTLNAVTGPVTGMAPQLAVTTGDAIDNAQWNEMQAFLALFDGGLVRPGSGGPGYVGVQSPDWPDDFFWKPDGSGANGEDIFRREFGFPYHPGLLERALAGVHRHRAPRPVAVLLRQSRGAQPGRRHDHPGPGRGAGRRQEAAAPARGLRPRPRARAVHRAARGVPGRPDRGDHRRPGPAGASPGATSSRRTSGPGSRPFGHGFSEQNRLDGTAYYVHDTPAARLIALDTSCIAGGADGCIDRDQARWLEARLAEVHSAYRGPDGREVRTGHDDRLVILFSHHGIDTLTNTRTPHTGPGGDPLLGAAEFTALLHRFRNVVLWLNGHTHTNAIRPRRDPADPARGFWEVTTCAIVDWPCQVRLVEILDAGDGLSIVCTMVDHDTPAVPRPL